MNVTFGTLSKRHNSTKQLTGGTDYACKLKDASSSLRPVISLQWPGSGSPCAFNVCYIPDYGRYYFVDNWTYADRQWIANCSVDVLATYKTEIGTASKYILRADTTENPDIMDGKYPPIFPITEYKYDITGDVASWATDFSGGRFILNIVGTGNNFSVAGSSFYELQATDIQTLVDDVFTGTDTLWNTPVTPTTDLAEALNTFGEKWSKSIENPIQFINSIYWIPFSPSIAVGTFPALTLGNFQTSVYAYPIAAPVTKQSWSCSIPIASGTTCWQNTPPFASYHLYFPPFGTFELDARKVYENGSINGYVIVDVTNGESILEVYSGSQQTKPMIVASAKVGTQITLSGANVDYAGVAKAAIGTVGGTIGSLIRGDVAGAITGGVSGIISTQESAAPTATNGGYGGGLASLHAFRGVVRTEMTTPTLDPTDQGVPVLDIKQISTLSGYVLCADGEIEIPGTAEEMAKISAYLTGGFFNE